MKNFNVKEHTNKYLKFSKNISKGIYPSNKVVKIGCKVGLGLGCTLFCVGIYGLTQNTAFGIGSLVIAILTITSNIICLKRIKAK